MEEQYVVPYQSMKYVSYQMDRPYDESIYYGHVPADSFGGLYTKAKLDSILGDLAKIVCCHVFNDNFQSNGGGKFSVCIMFTKHFLCVALCTDKTDENHKVMYYVDVHVVPEEVEEGVWKYVIYQIQAYRINDGKVPGLFCDDGGQTVGLRFPGSNGMPDKLPLVGITNKKFFISTNSSFIEGPHVPLYKQPFIFDWHYDNYNSEQNPTRGVNYEFNQKTENIASGASFYQFRFKKVS